MSGGRPQQPQDEIPPWMDELLRRIDESVEKRWQAQMESIGYDTTTPQARAAIREDHDWVRDWRSGTTKARLVAMLMFWTAVMGGVGKIFWDGAINLGRSLLRAKGGV